MSRSRKRAGDRLILALTQVAEAVESGRPSAHPSVTVREVEVREPAEFDAGRVAELRRRTGLSQAGFAKLVGSSVVTVQKWEQGRLKPNTMARRLMELIAAAPKRTTEGIVVVRPRNPARPARVA